MNWRQRLLIVVALVTFGMIAATLIQCRRKISNQEIEIKTRKSEHKPSKNMNATEITENKKPIIVKSRNDILVTKWVVTLPAPANLSVGSIHYIVRAADGAILWAGGTPEVIVLNEDGPFALNSFGTIVIWKRFSQLELPAASEDNVLMSKLETWFNTLGTNEGLSIDLRLKCPNFYKELYGDRSVPASLEIQDVDATAHGFSFKLKADGTATRIGVAIATNPLSITSCQDIPSAQ